MSAASVRLATYYNGNNYDVSTNPGGLALGGHRVNFVPACQDIATVGQEVASDAAKAQAAATQTGAWKDETTISTGVISRVNASTVRITGGGDRTDIYIAGRAIWLDQTTDTYGHVVSSSYNSTYTDVVVDVVVDVGLTAMSFGQDPRNAPASSSAGSNLYLAANYNCLGGW